MAAAERQPRDADGRTGSSRDHPAVLEQLLVDVDQSRARADRSRSRRGIRRDAAQTRDVDDDAAASGIARVAMSSGPRDDTDRVPLRPAHRAPDILCRLAEDNRPWADRVVARAVE